MSPRSQYRPTPEALQELTGVCSSMIIRNDRDDADYHLPVGAHPAVICLEGAGHAKGIGSLIHPRWILTAAHAAAALQDGHEISLGNKPRHVYRVVLHPSWSERPKRPSRTALADFADLALLELDRPIEEVEPLGLHTDAGEAGNVVTLVGNGGTGTGMTGAHCWDGIWRAATNRIEEVMNGSWLTLRFDEPRCGTSLEGIPGVGDSGSPALLRRGGRWLVVGVTSWEDASEARVRGGYGAWKFLVRTAAHVPWIRETLRASGDALAEREQRKDSRRGDGTPPPDAGGADRGV